MNANKRGTDNRKDTRREHHADEGHNRSVFITLTTPDSIQTLAFMKMSTARPSEPGPLEEMLRMMVMHEALTGSDARRYCSPVACVE